MEARAAFVGLIQVDPPAQVADYENWHACDHLPENWALPTVVYANRWVAAPSLLPARFSAEPVLEGPQFLIAYFFREPVEEAIDAFNALGARLTDAGRGFPHRRVVFGRYFDVTSAQTVAGEVVSAAALPHCRHAGALLALDKGPAHGEPALLGARGVMGCYQFESRSGPTHDALAASELRAELYFCREEPARVWSAVVATGGGSRAGALFCGAFGRSG